MIKLKSIDFLSSKETYLPILLFIISVAFLSLFVVLEPTNGDIYAYAYSIQYLEGSEIHPGYYFMGYFIHFFAILLYRLYRQKQKS